MPSISQSGSARSEYVVASVQSCCTTGDDVDCRYLWVDVVDRDVVDDSAPVVAVVRDVVVVAVVVGDGEDEAEDGAVYWGRAVVLGSVFVAAAYDWLLRENRSCSPPLLLLLLLLLLLVWEWMSLMMLRVVRVWVVAAMMTAGSLACVFSFSFEVFVSQFSFEVAE